MFQSRVKTKSGMEEVTALEIQDKNNIFISDDDNMFIRSQNKKKCALCRIPIFLDTETSHNHDKDNPTAWVYQFAFKFGSCYFVGRKPSELLEWFDFISKSMKLNESRKVVVYIHNLSYDLQYLKNYFIQTNKKFKILALKPHKIIQIETDFFIFKCSYLLSNRSLDAWCKALDTNYVKATNSIDYDEIRYQDSELTNEDWVYQLSDVASMEDCFKKECGKQFNVQTIPLTSTGFVRVDARREFRKDKKNREWFRKSALNESLYEWCSKAFMGGYTHGNRHFRGKIVKVGGKIQYIMHRDYRSFYPSTTRCDYFPMSKFSDYYEYNEKDQITNEEVDDLLSNYCCLLKVVLTNGRLKKGVTAPILSENKVYQNRLEDMKIKSDNGRVLEFSGATVQYLTELDWKWIKDQYTFDEVLFTNIAISERGYLPSWFNTLTDEYFYKKNTLKKVDPLEYAKSKNKLNSIYGMSASRIVRPEVIMDLSSSEWIVKEKEDYEEELGKYYNSRSSFMSYQWSLWVTGHCRDRLLTMIKDVVGYKNFLYADTDSIFYISNDDIEKRMEEVNAQNFLERKDLNQGIYNEKGEFVEYMTFEDEKDNITQFKFLHAKCYGMISDGELNITVAGVTRRSKDGTITRECELGSLDNLENGFTFKQCGGTYSEYVESLPQVGEINGHITEYSSACIIRDSEYEVKDIYDFWIEDVEECM